MDAYDLVLPRCCPGRIREWSAMAESLTKAKIEKFVSGGVPDGKTQTVLWDGAVTGLGLRLRLGGAASWTFQYRPKGAGRAEPSRKVTLGSWPTLAIDAARTAAQAMAGAVALKQDPAMELREERNRERRVLSKALDEYERAITRRKLVNVPTIMSTLRRGLSPLTAREIDALTRADLVGRIEALEDAGLPGAAADLRKHSRSLLEWAVSRGLAPFNVMAGLRMPRSSRAERLGEESKGKALQDEEIVALWNSAGRLGAFGRMLRLGLLTAMRRGELAGLRWGDIRDDRIVLEAPDTKTGARHEIPLTAAMRNVLMAQPKGAGDLVFPSSRRTTETPLSGWTKLVGSAVSASGVEFRLHDLRRTVRTLMSRCGVPEEVAELAVGHLKRGLVATYNKDDGWTARVSAFERVSAHVAGLVSGGASEADESAHEPRVVALSARR
jgi:integrase